MLNTKEVFETIRELVIVEDEETTEEMRICIIINELAGGDKVKYETILSIINGKYKMN